MTVIVGKWSWDHSEFISLSGDSTLSLLSILQKSVWKHFHAVLLDFLIASLFPTVQWTWCTDAYTIWIFHFFFRYAIRIGPPWSSRISYFDVKCQMHRYIDGPFLTPEISFSTEILQYSITLRYRSWTAPPGLSANINQKRRAHNLAQGPKNIMHGFMEYFQVCDFYVFLNADRQRIMQWDDWPLHFECIFKIFLPFVLLICLREHRKEPYKCMSMIKEKASKWLHKILKHVVNKMSKN